MLNFIRYILVGAVVIGAWGCVSKEWHGTEIPVPGHDAEVFYYRKLLPDFVGVEHERELRLGGSATVVELPVEPSGRDTVNVFVGQESAGSVLHLHERWGCYTVELNSATLTKRCPDSLGSFLGVIEANTAGTVRFLTADEGATADSTTW